VHANAHSNFVNQAPVPGEACAIEEIRASSASLVQEFAVRGQTGHRGPLHKTPPPPKIKAKAGTPELNKVVP